MMVAGGQCGSMEGDLLDVQKGQNIQRKEKEPKATGLDVSGLDREHASCGG